VVDSTQATPLVAGQAVKIVDSAGGVPKVVACSADTDVVMGHVAMTNKDQNFPAYAAVEIVMEGVIYLTATAAISRLAQVCGDPASAAGNVKASVAASGKPITGYALDKAVNAGDLIRVVVQCPAFRVS